MRKQSRFEMRLGGLTEILARDTLQQLRLEQIRHSTTRCVTLTTDGREGENQCNRLGVGDACGGGGSVAKSRRVDKRGRARVEAGVAYVGVRPCRRPITFARLL